MKETDIRPGVLFNQYLDVARRDIQTFFSDQRDFVEVECPGCGGDRRESAFNKLSFNYQICLDCSSLYVTPRASEKMLNHYYENGEAVKFWSSRFYKETEEARRDKIFKPRASLIKDLLQSGILANPRVFVDVGAGFGIFLEEVERLKCFDTVIGIEPGPDMASVCTRKGFKVIPMPIEHVSPADVQADMMTTFEVLEHVFSPVNFLRSIAGLLRRGGVTLFTTLTISGFDLQVLWDRSKSIYPPHHINFLSVKGMRRLVERCGLEVVSLETPGKLDIDIIRNAASEDRTLSLPRFVRSLLKECDPEVLDRFQTFLQQNNLSSHVRCIARKVGGH